MRRYSIGIMSVIVLLFLIPLVSAPGQQVILVTSTQDSSLSTLHKMKGAHVLVSNLEMHTFGTASEVGTLKYLRNEVQADWVSFGPLGFQKELNESEIRERWGYITSQTDRYRYRIFSIDYTDIPKTDELLKQGIEEAHKQGLKVMLKPYAKLDGFWKPTIITHTPKTRTQELQEKKPGYGSDSKTHLYPKDHEKRYFDALSLYLATLRSLGLQPDPATLKAHYQYQTRFKKIIDTEVPIEKKWSEWFDNYRAFILHYAQKAQEEKVELFVIGDSLWPATQYEHEWRSLIKEIKEIYKGKLTYAAQPNEYEQIKFWDALDYVGINAYFKVGTKERLGPYQEYKNGWQRVANKLEAFHTQVNKPILFTEIGTPSIGYAGYYAPQPLDNIKEILKRTPTQSNDDDAQRIYYETFFQVFFDKPWLAGTFWWTYYTNTDDYYRSVFNVEFSPYNKPAEGILKKYYQMGKYYKTSSTGVSKPPYTRTPLGHEGRSDVFYYQRADAAQTKKGTATNQYATAR